MLGRFLHARFQTISMGKLGDRQINGGWLRSRDSTEDVIACCDCERIDPLSSRVKPDSYSLFDCVSHVTVYARATYIRRAPSIAPAPVSRCHASGRFEARVEGDAI